MFSSTGSNGLLTEAEEALYQAEEAILVPDGVISNGLHVRVRTKTHPACTSTTNAGGLVLVLMLSLLGVDRGSGVHSVCRRRSERGSRKTCEHP